MMARLFEADDLEERWTVLPQIKGDGHRLMEHIGKGRWVERRTGTLKELTTMAAQRNKDGYVTPLNQQEKTEVARFSVMERARVRTL